MKTNKPCAFCGRHDKGKWFKPCPSADCPSNHVKYGLDCVNLGQGDFVCYHAFKGPKAIKQAEAI